MKLNQNGKLRVKRAGRPHGDSLADIPKYESLPGQRTFPFAAGDSHDSHVSGCAINNADQAVDEIGSDLSME